VPATTLPADIARTAWRASPAGYGLRLIPGFQLWRHIAALSKAYVWAMTTPGARLIVNMPPQYGKSILTSLAGPVWALDHWPTKRIALASYEANFALRWGRQVRDLIVANPTDLRVRIRGDAGAAAGDWETTEGGGMLTTGAGGPLTGRSVDAMIVDDPHKNWQEAHSALIRDNVWDWWRSTVRTRLQPGAPVIVVMCIMAGMRVLRGDGRWVPVEDIVPGDSIVSLSADATGLRTALVTGARRSGTEATVTVSTARLSLTTNARHPYAVLRRRAGRPAATDIEWIRAGELAPGDIVVTAKSLPDDHAGNDTLPDGSAVTAERAWLLGYMLGDGWVTRQVRRNQQGQPSTYAVCVAAGKSDASVKAELPVRVCAAISDWSTSRVYETSGGYLRTDWAAGGRVLCDMGYSAGAKNKRVPDAVWGWSVPLRQEFLRGFLMADGCLTRQAGPRTEGETWTAVSVNADLLADVRDLALTCGVRPTFVFHNKPRLYQPPSSPSPVWSTLHSLRLTFHPDEFGEGRSALAGYVHPAPRHLRYEKVRSIEHGPPADVYDLAVDGTENFVAEGFVVHNTRWHAADLAGRLTDPKENPDFDRWRVLRLPAIAEGDDDPLGRREGEVLEPRRFSTAEVLSFRRDLGSQLFAGLYQQRPSPAGGGIIKRSWWKWYSMRPGLPRFDEIIASWDMAFKETATSSYVVGQVWGRIGADIYLLDQVRDRMDFPSTIVAVLNLSAKWPIARAKLVEDKANGPAVIATLARKVPGLIAVQVEGSKEARLHAVSPLIEAGNVFLPDPVLAPWIGDFVEELSQFPSAPNDDQADAASMALERLSRGYGQQSDYRHEGGRR
jgi:predicted phage terminase large subunit-like protein